MKDKGSAKNGRRKKLVNIISKLATDQLQRSENEENIVVNDKDDLVDQNVVKHLSSESRRKSKRKPEKAAKSSADQDVITIEASNNEQLIHEARDTDKVLFEIPDENLTTVKAVQSDSDLEETIEDEKVSNSNEENVEKQRNHKNDAKEKVDIGHRIVSCTACSKSIQTKKGRFCRHPDLNTIICKQCHKFYSSGKFTKDEYGVEEFCRWCADGGQLICCDFCEKAFCKKCIKRNLGKSKLQELLEADESEKWNCFCCDPAPISGIIKSCNQIMRMQEAEKDQHSPYKDKKGRKIISGPSRSERRNLLTSLSGEKSVKSEPKTLSKSTKKTYSKRFENGFDSSTEDTEKNVENSDNDSIEEINAKKDIDIDMTVQSDEESDSDKDLKSRKKGKSASKTKINNIKEISSSESDVLQRKSTAKKMKSNVDSSSEQEQSRSKKRKRVKKKTEKSARRRVYSDSLDDFVQPKKNKKKKTESKKSLVSSDEECNKQTSETEDSDTSEHSSSEPSSPSESDSDDYVSLKKQRKKKSTTKTGRWTLRNRRNGSDDNDSNSDIGRLKKSKKKTGKKKKVKRKRNDDDNDDDEKSEEENVTPSKKGRKEIRKILDNAKLAEATRHARQLEEERRQRLLEKTKNTVFDKPENTDVKEVVLEYKSDGTTPLLAVEEDLVKHLKPHQVEGVKFMYDCTIESVDRWKKKEEGGGCILAHVMGLGKTLQVVSLVHTLYRSDLVELRRVLVLCPLNTVLNWQVEFEKWINVDDRLDVYVLSEVSGNWNRADMLKGWMNYGGVLIMGYALYRNLSQCLRIKSKKQKQIFKQALVDPGPELVVCDEGHVLRNCKSAISIAMNQIKTKRRVVLTGTPLQNNLLEYHCMVSFVKPNLLGTLKEFSNSFIRPIQNGQCADSTVYDVKLMKKRCHVLHKTLEGCVQRKDYSEISRYLPPKFEYVIKVRLSAKQREMYRYYLDTFVDENNGRGASLFSDYQALLRIWTHPWSLKLESEKQSKYNFIDSDNDSLADFVVSDEESDEESDEDMLLLNDTSTSESSSDSDADVRGKKKKDKSKSEIAGSKRKSEKQADKKETARNVKIDPDGPSTSADFVVVDDDDDIEEVKPVVTDKAVEERNGASVSNRQLRSGNEVTEVTEVAEEEWYDKFLTDEDENNIELGSKIVLLLEILADAAALEEKVLVFSHSLISLDVIEMALGGGEIGGNSEDWCRGCDYFRMDGSTSAQMRKRWADIFNDEENKSARLFLISTKAGGLGINLIGASRVVVFDISWNPSHDVQSIFRAYRFGQNRPVFVYRFIAEGTMEEKIYDRQVTKLSMSQRVVDEHQIQRHFNANDLAELYRFEPDVLESEDTKRPTPVVPKVGETYGKKMMAGYIRSKGQVLNRSQIHELLQRQRINPTDHQRRRADTVRDAVLAELINRLYPKWIVKYHEHDSLLQNRPDEGLTEDERKEAWEHWELEKKGILNGPPTNMEQMQQMTNGVRMPNPGGASGPNPAFAFTFGGARVQVPSNAAQGPSNYSRIVMEEHRRRLYAMRMQEEAQQRAREQLLRIQQQQQEQRRRQEEEEKRVREARIYTDVQRQRQEQERKRQEEERKRQEQQRRLRQQQEHLRQEEERKRQEQERKRQEEERKRQEQQRRLRQQQEHLRQQQERLRQEQQMRSGQEFLRQLLRDRNASVSRQAQPGNPGQSVFRIVLNNEKDNLVRPQRPRRSPPRIIELPPDA